MSPLDALRAARRHGVEVIAAHGSLHLHARMAPPDWVWRALAERKAAIIDLLRPDAGGWTGEDWAVFFEERAAILEYDHGLTRLEAEIRAHEQTEAERARRLDAAA
ncbi:MAG: hypothetical protein AB7O88_26535 [Reyranellaceae bacterium]